MKPFYLRWAAIFVVAVAIGSSGFLRYASDVKTVSPEEVIRSGSPGSIRVLGTVEAGSLVLEGTGTEEGPAEARFSLSGDPGLRVHYIGAKPENLRELKKLVIEGRWEPVSKRFQAHKIAVVPNYRFVTAAYFVAILPLGIFLFLMERRVRLLFYEIKETTVYEPEKIFDNG
jgi:cytochrome c-type biogenesis protein CcmE